MAAASLRPVSTSKLHVFLCIADHFEPMWNAAAYPTQCDRVERWVSEYPRVTAGFVDSRGQRPQHTFFYPAEEYDAHLIDRVAHLCNQGHGAMEVHLHHDNDSPGQLRDTLEGFKIRLHNEHGQLEKNSEGDITYGFVHGNWALCNSLPGGHWCGVNDEISVLRQTGCYADFTLPAVPSPAQTTTINSIYYAVSDPLRPKAHDTGIAARVGLTPERDRLLMIQGPTMLDWRKRRSIFPPGLENGDLHSNFPPCERRLKLWLRAGVGVAGRPDWLFIKLHTHGAPEHNAAMLLGEPIRAYHESLNRFARASPDFHYYYVTAREMACLVHQAEEGATVPSFKALAPTNSL